MLPLKRNKVDISKLTEEEQKLFRLYGKLPTHKNVLTKMQKDRKYFDSGDYALSKAGKAPQNTVGTAIPNPDNIPHATSPPVANHLSVSPTGATSPNKESPLSEPLDSLRAQILGSAEQSGAKEGEEAVATEAQEEEAEEKPAAPVPAPATAAETETADSMIEG